MEKIFLTDVMSLFNASFNKEQVFIEYRGKIEAVENSELFKQSDWLFTLKVLNGVTYFKFLNLK